MTNSSAPKDGAGPRTKAEVLRAILRQRGYIVLWQASYHTRFKIGRIIRELGAERVEIGLFRVRQETTRADFLKQQVLSRKIEPKLWAISPTAMLREIERKVGPVIVYWRVTRTTRKVTAKEITHG